MIIPNSIASQCMRKIINITIFFNTLTSYGIRNYHTPVSLGLYFASFSSVLICSVLLCPVLFVISILLLFIISMFPELCYCKNKSVLWNSEGNRQSLLYSNPWTLNPGPSKMYFYCICCVRFFFNVGRIVKIC